MIQEERYVGVGMICGGQVAVGSLRPRHRYEMITCGTPGGGR